MIIKFIYSEKATKFYEIFTLLLSNVLLVKSKVMILQNFVAFSEYMNFTAERQQRMHQDIEGHYTTIHCNVQRKRFDIKICTVAVSAKYLF